MAKVSTTSKLLEVLVQRASHFGAEYQEGLSNHLPMALFALNRLGASDARLRAFYSFYEKRLTPKTHKNLRLSDANWQCYQGEHCYNTAYLAFFSEHIQNKGITQSLEYFLPFLWPGVAGGAFHPLIRVAYGIAGNSEQEVAEGLAAWAMAYLSLEANTKVCCPQESMQRLENDSYFSSLKVQGPNLFTRIQTAASHSHFVDFCNSLRSCESSLKEIARASLHFYQRSSDSFTALHFVTATHATRLLMPYTKNPSEALSHLWTAILAAAITVTPLTQPLPIVPQTLPSWSDIAKAAIASNNDHVIKLIYTLREEANFYDTLQPPSRYQAVAAEKVHLH